MVYSEAQTAGEAAAMASRALSGAHAPISVPTPVPISTADVDAVIQDIDLAVNSSATSSHSRQQLLLLEKLAALEARRVNEVDWDDIQASMPGVDDP